jgi:hypothetical protein
MQANVGGIDKVARLGAGVVLVVLAATGTIGAWGWLGIVPLATGLIGWCPAYTLFGMNSCAKK